MLLWIGSKVDPGFLQAVFGANCFEQLDSASAEAVIGTRGDHLSNKIAAIIRQIRAERPVPFLHLHVVKTGEHKEGRFWASLIEDRTMGLQSTYSEFLTRNGYRPQQQAPPQHQQQQGPPQMQAMPMGGAMR